MMKAMAMSTPDRDFHLGRALLHGILGFAVCTVLAMAFVGTDPFGGSMEKLAEAASKQAGWMFLLGLAASYAFQTSRRTLGSLLLLVMTGLFTFQLYALARVAQARENADSPLTPAEKRRPAPTGGDRFCQAALAFSFPAPEGNMVPDLKLEGEFQVNDPHGARWIWRDAGRGSRLIILVAKGIPNNESSFRSFIAGFKESISPNAASQLGTEEFRWRPEGGEYNVSGTSGTSARLDMRCLSRGAEGETPPLLVCAQTMTAAGTDSLRPVRTGLSLAPCGTAGD